MTNNPSSFLKTWILAHMYLFVTTDAVKKSLQPNYDGPYEVISRNPKFFCVKIKGKEKQISIDRLKPMFVVQDLSIHPEQTNRIVSFLS